MEDKIGYKPVDKKLAKRLKIKAKNHYTIKDSISTDFNGFRFEIFKGFITDLASVPFPLNKLIYDISKTDTAALLHDALYATKYIPRKEADQIFFARLEHDGFHPDYKNIMYSFVRLFGWYSYWKVTRIDNYNKDYVRITPIRTKLKHDYCGMDIRNRIFVDRVLQT